MTGTAAVIAAYASAVVFFGAWVAIMMRRSGRRAAELSRLEDR